MDQKKCFSVYRVRYTINNGLELPQRTIFWNMLRILRYWTNIVKILRSCQIPTHLYQYQVSSSRSLWVKWTLYMEKLRGSRDFQQICGGSKRFLIKNNTFFPLFHLPKSKYPLRSKIFVLKNWIIHTILLSYIGFFHIFKRSGDLNFH